MHPTPRSDDRVPIGGRRRDGVEDDGDVELGTEVAAAGRAVKAPGVPGDEKFSENADVAGVDTVGELAASTSVRAAARIPHAASAAAAPRPAPCGTTTPASYSAGHECGDGCCSSCAAACDRCEGTVFPPGIITRTHVLTLLGVALDVGGIAFAASTVSAGWVANTSDAVPPGDAISVSTVGVSWGLFSAGTLEGGAYVPLSSASVTVVGVNVSAAFPGWYFSPSSLAWNELNSVGACAADSPALAPWGLRYGMCSPTSYSFVGPDPNLVTAQAFIFLGLLFSGASILMLVAARKGRVGFAQASTVFSALSTTCLVVSVAVFFDTWAYTSNQLAVFVGTVPLRAVSPSGLEEKVLAVAVSMTRGASYYLLVVGAVLEALSTVVSWLVGTERFFWRPSHRDLNDMRRAVALNDVDNARDLGDTGDDDDEYGDSADVIRASLRRHREQRAAAARLATAGPDALHLTVA